MKNSDGVSAVTREPFKLMNADRVSSRPIDGRIGPAHIRWVNPGVSCLVELGVGRHVCYLDGVGGSEVSVYADGFVVVL